MKDKVKKVLVGASAGATTLAVTGMTAFASEGTGIVSGAIDTAVAGLKNRSWCCDWFCCWSWNSFLGC